MYMACHFNKIYTIHKAKLAVSFSGWLGRYTNVEYMYLQSLYLKRRGQLLFQV